MAVGHSESTVRQYCVSMIPKKTNRLQHFPLVWFLVCTFESCLNAYPSGAPSSACASMLPQHGVGPQNTGSPYSLHVNGSTYRYGETVKEKYRGILLQARSSNTSAIVGSWIKLPANINTLKCGSAASSAVTHNSRREKDGRELVFTWLPPKAGAPQVLEFWATVVKDEDTFWTEIKSSVLWLDESVPAPNNSESAAGRGMHLSGDVIIITVWVCVWISWCV